MPALSESRRFSGRNVHPEEQDALPARGGCPTALLLLLLTLYPCRIKFGSEV